MSTDKDRLAEQSDRIRDRFHNIIILKKNRGHTNFEVINKQLTTTFASIN